MSVYTALTTNEIPKIVASLCGGDPLSRRIIFCEDKFTLALELAIAKEHGGTFGTHVYSFNRYMHKHLPLDKKILSTEGCSLVVKGLLLKHKSELTCFKNVYDPNLASTVYELIAQLKSARVTPEDILHAYQESTGNLKRKLKDIHLIFKAYEEYVEQNGLTDGNNRLYRLPQHFNEDSNIKNTKVIIAGFPSLNRTLCDIFKSLVKNAHSVDFVLVAGDNSGVYTNETFNFVTGEYPNEEVISSESLPVIKQLLSGLFCPAKLSEEGKYFNNVHLYKAEDPTEEITFIAQLIKNGVINGASYKDYSVCAEDICAYELTIRRVFEDYGIPLFFDSAKNLGKHPLTRLVCAYFDLVRRNFDLQDLFTLVKNPLFCSDKRISDGFENYCLANSANRKTVKNPFTYEHENLEEYENLRSTAVEVCSYLNGVTTFESAVIALNKMLERVNAFDKIKNLSATLTGLNRADISAYNDQAEEKFNVVINDAVNLLGPLTMPLVEVKNVILSGMTACTVSVIPEYNDCVFVGDFRSVKYNGVKNLFAVGLTDGVPLSKIDSALLCDRDIVKMERSKVLVEPKIKEVNRRAREVACMALASFTDHLYLSYPQRLFGGEEGKMSEILRYVVQIFSTKDKKTQIYSIEDYQNLYDITTKRGKDFALRKYLSKRSAIKAFAGEIGDYKEGKTSIFDGASAYYKVVKEKEDGEVAGAILTSTNTEVGYYTDGVNYAEGKLSATAIEGHFNCPYANFLQRGVKLLEREELDIRANDLGTMVHEVGETFIDKVDWNCSLEQAKALAESIFSQISEKQEYKRYQQSESGKSAFELIKKESVRFCLNMFEATSHSQLKPKYLEVYFGGKKYPPIKVDTRKGQMAITGKVDRIDSDGENMAVIDYKTGKVEKSKTDLNLYTGRKLQLFLYAKAFNGKLNPIGAYYFPISDNFVEDEDKQETLYVGKTIADSEKATLLDDTLKDGRTKSTYLNANFTVNKDGAYRWPQGLLSERDFKAYTEYSLQVAGEGLSEIAEGVIVPSPYEGACDYCKYLGICGYNEQTDLRTRAIEKIEKVDLLRAVNMAGEDCVKQEVESENGDKEN